jgi:hypothetical protein
VARDDKKESDYNDAVFEVQCNEGKSKSVWLMVMIPLLGISLSAVYCLGDQLINHYYPPKRREDLNVRYPCCRCLFPQPAEEREDSADDNQ